MDSRNVNRALRSSVRPLLRELGFDAVTERSAWLHWHEGVDVVNVQSFSSYLATGIGSTTFSYAVNLGVLLNYFPHDPRINLDRPRQYECDLRLTLRKGVAQPYFHPYDEPEPEDWLRDRSDVWYVKADGSNLDECMEDTRKQLVRCAIPLFELAHEPEGVLQLLQPPHLGNLLEGSNPDSPAYAYRMGFVLARIGRPDDARAYLEPLLSSRLYEATHQDITHALNPEGQ